MTEFPRDRLPEPASFFASEGLTLKGTGTWRTAACEFHHGSDSMRVNVQSGAFVCMAGCGARGGDVLAYHMAAHGLGFIDTALALGAWHSDGQPSKSHRPKPIPPTAAIQVLAYESNIAAVAAQNMARGTSLTGEDRARLLVAAQRIQRIGELLA